MEKSHFVKFAILMISLGFFSCEENENETAKPVVLNMVKLGDELEFNAGLPDDLIRVEGTGLSGMSLITFDGIINTPFNTALNSDVVLFFNVPFDEELGSRFGTQTVTFTNQFGDTVSSEFEIKEPAPNFVQYLISDFDGGGVPAINQNYNGDWFSYGDRQFRIEAGLGVDASGGAELIWDDTGTDGFSGSSHQAIAPLTSSTDAENAFLVIDINGDGFPGTVMEFVVEDSQSNWLFKVPLEGTGWQTLRLRLSDFGFNFDPNNQGNGDVNPAEIFSYKMQISHEGGFGVVPSGYKYDNVILEVLESN